MTTISMVLVQMKPDQYKLFSVSTCNQLCVPEHYLISGLENSTRPLVFTSVSGCRASEYFDISTEN